MELKHFIEWGKRISDTREQDKKKKDEEFEKKVKKLYSYYERELLRHVRKSNYPFCPFDYPLETMSREYSEVIERLCSVYDLIDECTDKLWCCSSFVPKK